MHNEGLYQTLDAGLNHFHSGVLWLIGKLAQCDPGVIRYLAALAEVSWTALIIMDDLGDGEPDRRGEPTLWRSKGMLHASQCAWTCSLDVCRVLAETELADSPGSQVPANYARMMSRVGRAQMLRAALGFESTSVAYIRSLIGIASHLPWWLELLLSKSPVCRKPSLRRAWRKLAVAGGIKNDLEDVFLPGSNYKQQGTDLKGGQVTYAVKLLYQRCGPKERLTIHRLFDSRRVEAAAELAELFARKPEVERELFAIVSRLTDDAIQILRASFPQGEPEALNSLERWAQRYKVLGNPLFFRTTAE